MTDETVTGSGVGDVARISSTRVGAAMLVTIAGELNMLTAPKIQEHLTRAIAGAGNGPVVLDMTEVSFLGAAGMGALVAAMNDKGGKCAPIRVVVDRSRAATRSLQITGLSQKLALFHDVQSALTAPAADDGPIQA